MTEQFQDTKIYAGDNKDIVVTIKDEVGTPINVTGCTIHYYAKRYPSATPTLTKTNAAGGTGVTLTTPGSGIITVHILPADTATLGGSFMQLVTVTDTTGIISTVMVGTLSIVEKSAASVRRPVYTTVEDVVSHLRLIDKKGNRLILTEDAKTSKIMRSEVEDHIFAAEDYIDQYCNDSWRLVASEELIFSELYNWARLNTRDIAIPLGDVAITQFDSDEGDVLQFFDGASWQDYLGPSYSEGANLDWWCDYTRGFLYIRRAYGVMRYPMLKVKYRHGHATVPYDIREACAKMAAADILMSDFFSVILPQGGDFSVSRSKTADKYEEDAKVILERHRRVFIQ